MFLKTLSYPSVYPFELLMQPKTPHEELHLTSWEEYSSGETLRTNHEQSARKIPLVRVDARTSTLTPPDE